MDKHPIAEQRFSDGQKKLNSRPGRYSKKIAEPI